MGIYNYIQYRFCGDYLKCGKFGQALAQRGLEYPRFKHVFELSAFSR